MISIVRQTAKVEPCTGRAAPPPPPTFNCRRVAAVDNLSMLIILWHICTLNDFDVRCCLEVDIYIFSFSPQDILVSVSVVRRESEGTPFQQFLTQSSLFSMVSFSFSLGACLSVCHCSPSGFSVFFSWSVCQPVCRPLSNLLSVPTDRQTGRQTDRRRQNEQASLSSYHWLNSVGS